MGTEGWTPKRLRRLGFLEEDAIAAAQRCCALGRAAGRGDNLLENALRAVLKAPDQFVDHPVWAELARVLSGQPGSHPLMSQPPEKVRIPGLKRLPKY